MRWKTGLTILLALAVLVARQSRLGAYLLVEAVSFLLLIAAVLILVLAFLIVFFVLWHAVRSCVLWVKDLGHRIGATSSDPLSSEKEIRHPILR